MSKENVVRFVQAVNNDRQLRSRIDAAEATIDAWLNIARESGFEFTADEFKSVLMISNTELGDETLEQVVGGTTATFKDIPVVKNTDKSTP